MLKHNLIFSFAITALATAAQPDVVVYSGVPCGIAASITAAREGAKVLLIEPTSLDWLYLAHDGHRRAQFTRTGPGQDWQGTWVVP